MNILEAIILGIVEGVTEFLPISSTGHLILASNLLHIEQTNFLKSFEIMIQLGAILAVIYLYGRDLIVNIGLIKKLLVAFLPTAVIGLVLYPFVKSVLLGSQAVVLWSLFLGGIFLIVFELKHKESALTVSDPGAITYKQSFLIGLFQSVAIIPGVSRAAATIVGGLFLGINRRTIVEFSFLLAIPTMAAATGLDLLKSYDEIFNGQIGILLVGFAVSFVTAIIGIKFLLRFINNHKFTSFGIYRILVAVLFWFLVI